MHPKAETPIVTFQQQSTTGRHKVRYRATLALMLCAVTGALQGFPRDCPAREVERFVVIGDSGERGHAQLAVAASIASVCEARGGCQYGLMNGDNFYPAGVISSEDPAWCTHFEDAFGKHGFPYYATLGNHDYGGVSDSTEVPSCTLGELKRCIGNLRQIGPALKSGFAESTGGIGLDPSRVQPQIDYASAQTTHCDAEGHPRRTTFRLPGADGDAHYRELTQQVELVALDTTPIYWDDANIRSAAPGGQFGLRTLRKALEKADPSAAEMFEHARSQTDKQRVWLKALHRDRSEAPVRRWRIAMGHHPYVSNGSHGNAGDYNGTGHLEGDFLPKGTRLGRFVEELVIGRGFHVYLSGHDHNLQDIGEYKLEGMERGTQMVLSGSASKVTPLRKGEIEPDDYDQPHNATLFQDACHGFVLLEASESKLEIIFVGVHFDSGPTCDTDAEGWTEAPREGVRWKILHQRTVPHYLPG